MLEKKLKASRIDFFRSKKLFLKIYPNEKLEREIERYIFENTFKVSFFLNFCRNNNWKICLKLNPMMKLSLVFAFLPTVWDRYTEKGIGEDIFFETMSDIKIWIDDYKKRTGKDGLDELNWIMHHMNLDIFKIGRLQFQKYFYSFKQPYEKDGDKTCLADKILFVHIPRGEKLDIEECEKSFEKASRFFEKYFPEYPNRKFFCHSWLLYSGNKNFMNENSNILKFSGLFINIKEHENPQSPYLYIFGVEKSNDDLFKMKKRTGSYGYIDCLPQKSSLQKSAVKYINNGGTLGEAFGVRFI